MEISNIEFTYTEERMIQNMWTSKPIAYIAMILDKPIALVRSKIDQMVADSPEPVRLWVRKADNKHQPVSSMRRRKEKEWAKDFLNDPRQMQAPNLEGKKAVRIDHRTVVFVKPGTDIEALKEKYRNHKMY